MSVEFIPNNSKSYGFGTANQTWFTVLEQLKKNNIKVFDDADYSNDPLYVSKHDALKAFKIIKKYNFPNSCGKRMGSEESMKKIFLDFFERCDGFRTR